MRTLIISLPRTGSSSLLEKISKEKNLKYVFEPFDGTNRWIYSENDDDVAVKTLIFDKPDNWKTNIDFYLDLSKQFNEIILLSRKNLKECAESWAYYRFIKDLTGKSLMEKYHWEMTSNFDQIYEKIITWDRELKTLSEKLNIPITYYEDIFDTSSQERYRSNISPKQSKTVL